jgi:hypothetical protein
MIALLQAREREKDAIKMKPENRLRKMIKLNRKTISLSSTKGKFASFYDFPTFE